MFKDEEKSFEQLSNGELMDYGAFSSENEEVAMVRLFAGGFLTLAVIACGLSGFAAQQESGPSGDFEAFDQDGDNKLTRDEYIEGVKTKTFNTLDADADGQVSKAEWGLADESPEAEENFNKIDSNKDKVVDKTEHASALEVHSNLYETFNWADADKDKTLSKSEFEERPGLTLLTVKF